MSSKLKPSASSDSDLETWLASYLNDRAVCSMDNFIQHGCTTTLQHCMSVMKASLAFASRLHLRVNYKNLAVGALLHDFYLYDWHGHPRDGQPLHGFIHPTIACRNAAEHFRINPEVEHIIRTHMWPLTLRSVPTTKEAVIVCLVDKYVSTLETLAGLCRLFPGVRSHS